MHTFLDSKTMAKLLRAALAERHIDVTYSDSLELVARQYGFDNWNILAARIDAATVDALAVPPGWYTHQSAPYPLFRMGLDPSQPATAKLMSIASSDVVGTSHATLMQSIAADDYRGQKLRLTAELRGEDVAAGTIWMRVDSNAGGKSLRFDNMLMRSDDGALTGNFSWTERSIVLDVPDEAGTIHYGPMLKGVGQLWCRRIRLEPASPDATITGARQYPRRPSGFGGEAAA